MYLNDIVSLAFIWVQVFFNFLLQHILNIDEERFAVVLMYKMY